MSAATNQAKRPGHPAATIAPTLLEIATVDKDIFFPAYFGILHPNDDTLTTRGQGKGLKIYDELERDGDVFGDLQKRKLVVIGRLVDLPGPGDDGQLALLQIAKYIAIPLQLVINLEALALAACGEGIVIRMQDAEVGGEENILVDRCDLKQSRRDGRGGLPGLFGLFGGGAHFAILRSV